MNPLDAYRATQAQQPIQPLTEKIGSTPDKENQGEGPSFQSVLGDLVKQVDGLQADANRSIEGLVTGETENLHDVTVRMAEAGVAFDLMMEVRNKLLDAYQQISQIRA